MSDDVWDALNATSLAEVRRRAAVSSEITGFPPLEVDGAQRFAWSDFAGQFTAWYFTSDGRALLLTFDHDLGLNLYNDDQYDELESIYDEVPDDLVRLVRDRPAADPCINVKDPGTGRTLHCAGGIFWYDGKRWRIAEGLLDHCERENSDPCIESALDYCLGPYRFGAEFITPQDVVAERVRESWTEAAKAEELGEVREIFARYA